MRLPPDLPHAATISPPPSMTICGSRWRLAELGLAPPPEQQVAVKMTISIITVEDVEVDGR